MIKDFKKGIITASIYYGIGLGLALLSLLVWDNQYAHAPGPPFIFAALVIIGGALLLLINLLLFAKAINREIEKGSMLVHVLIIAGACIFIAVLINKENKTNDSISQDESQYLIIGKESKTLTIKNESGDTTFFQKGDSVVIYMGSLTKKEK